MDFIDEVRTRSGRFADRIDHLETEEATKSSLVLPFLQMLGYEIFDPTEVVPEFTADVGTKKGEKVDYALMQDGKPVILIECKKYGSNLNEADVGQLLRYFTVTDARFGVLTDGISYRFFSDLDEPKMMDQRPFFEFNMLDFTEPQVRELKRFTKMAFDMGEIVDAARELKYTTEIKRVLAEELAGPSEDFVRFIIKQVYEGRVTPPVREMFGSLTDRAFKQFINERIDDRLKSALQRNDAQEEQPDEAPAEDSTETDEPEFVDREIESLNVIKAIARDIIDVRCIGLRAAKTYTSVVLHDGPERTDYGKLICRLRVRREGYLRLDLDKPYPLDDIDSLFDYADQLRAGVAAHTSPSDSAKESAQ
jgi:hypothetical protein